MKTAWILHGILLVAMSAASSAIADDPFKAGDKVTVQYRNERSGGQVVVAA